MLTWDSLMNWLWAISVVVATLTYFESSFIESSQGTIEKQIFNQFSLHEWKFKRAEQKQIRHSGRDEF